MANIFTGIRILCGILILIFPAFSGWYYSFFLLGCLSDAIDGTVARKRNEQSDFGSRFDTVADFVFAICVLIKLISSLNFPLQLTLWILVIILIKVLSHVAGYIKYHELRTCHNVLNKVCGAISCLIPLFVGGDYAWQAKLAVIVFVCILATVSSVVEGISILR